jgi:hypothetical protein
MNPKSGTFFLPTSCPNDSFSWVVAGGVESGALSPTSRAATQEHHHVQTVSCRRPLGGY